MKKQIKKSISLFMAVMMLLSCWVWVAPEKAEAAGAEDGQYYFKWVVSEISEAGNSGKWSGNTLQINYKKADGTDGSTTINLDKSKYSSTGKNKVVWEGWIDGFPTWAGWYMKMEWKAAASVYLNAREATYYVGSSSSNVQAVSNTDSFKWQNNAVGQGTKEGTLGLSTKEDAYPKISSFSGKPADVTVKVPDISATLEKKAVFSSNFSIKCYDQYGVRITDATELAGLSYGIKTMNVETQDFDSKFNEETYSLWYESNNVYYNRDVQVKLPKTDLKKYYLFVHFTSTRYGNKNDLLSTITLDYPEYTIKVEPNGSIENLGASMDMSDGTTMTTIWEQSGVYGTTPSPFPSGTASKEGYTFKGFWTTPQPESGAADYNAYEADFSNPVATTTFEAYVAQGGVTSENGMVVTTADGKKYYNAGKQWDKTVDKEIKGPATFYGWWISSDVEAKFYDVDGTYLGTQITKYNVTEPESWYPNPKDGYNTGSYEYQGFKKQWMDISGLVIAEGSYKFGTDNVLSLTLTPVYEKADYKNEFYITFINPNDGKVVNGGTTAQDNNDIGSDYYNYRHILSGKNIPTVNMPGVLSNDPGYSYVFDGWTTQKPASGNYHKIAKDDTSIVASTDLVVREDATYYAIYRSTVKEYLVSYSYTEATGEYVTAIKTVPYGSIISTPAEVNRTYAEDGLGYDLTGWEYYDPDWNTQNLGVDDNLLLNNTNFAIANNNLAPNGNPVQLFATYGEGKPTPYDVTFKYKDANGVSKTFGTQVYHGSKITEETVNELRLLVPAEYDDGEALYKFANMWKVTEGTADEAEYTYDEFTSFKPTSHVTFEAAYGEGTPFYTVTYHSGTSTYKERILAGANVPAWMIQTGTDEETGEGIYEEYVPTLPNAETGRYVFAGWFDAKQTSEGYLETNGTKYTTADTVEGNLDLYAQFLFEPFKFNVKFVNYDGSVLAEGDYEAGVTFEETYNAAVEAAELIGKPADETYYYSFIGWDLKIPDNFICEGRDIVYTAQYRGNYIYYKANWYNSTLVDGEWVATGDALATTSYTYGGRVYAPAVALTLPDASESGKVSVFDGWKYIDAEGNEGDYVRGMEITGNMTFYAVYSEENTAVTLTTVVNGEEYKYSVAYGEKADIGDPVDGYVDADYHNTFIGWFTTETCTCEEDYLICTHVFSLNTKLTADTTIYARFDKEPHTDIDKKIIEEATYYSVGKKLVGCICSDETNREESIEILQDTTAPTGTIYLGGQSWSSTGTPAYETDNDPISIFVNGNDDVIITAHDAGIGVKLIRAFAFPANTVLTAENYGAAQDLAVTVFEDTSRELTRNANYTVKLKDFKVADLAANGSVQYNDDGSVKDKKLQDGESYIIYYYVNDKATVDNGAPATGNQLNRLVRTAKFTYDITKPEITISGDSDAATAKNTVTYCGKAVIKGIENDATLTVNGEVIALTSTGANGKANYTIDEAGNYLIKVTDKAGNSTSKKIIVAAGHDEVTTSKAVSCTEDGYEKITCATCGKVIKNEEIKASGHQYSEVTTVAPTCEAEGYDIKTCSVCGDEVKTNETEKVGHTYEKDEDGNIIYETVTDATCSTAGKAIANCTVCGKGTKETELAVDTKNGHKYGAVKTLKATCTEAGEEYQICKLCFEKVTIKELPKLNHENTGRYTKVTTTPTCTAEGEETTYCKACNEVMGTAAIEKAAHTLILVKHADDKSEEYPAGYMQYECQATGCTYTEGKTAIAVKAEYTVTFVGAGVDGADVVITKTEGESIAAGAVADLTKASDNESNYTFAGWKAESTGKVVKLPVVVTKNETYTAEFKATTRTYTHQFVVRDDEAVTRASEEVFATIVGTYNSADKKPAAVPTKAATANNTYEFDYWAKEVVVENEDGTTTKAYEKVEDFTMTGDATFYAIFKAVPVKYTVLFYDENRTTVIWNTEVNGGTNVTYAKAADGELVVPTKAADADKHYTFAGWKYGSDVVALDESFGPISATTRVYATYTGTEHSFAVVEDADKTWAATCTKEGQTTEVCACGYEKVTAIPKADHNYELQQDGSKICSVCGDTIAPDVKVVTITFTDGEKVLKVVKLEEGKTCTFTAPEKASTAQYEYKFEKWTSEGAEDVATAEITVTAGTEDATYTAVYTATTRIYNVSYLDYNNKAISTYKIPYDGVVPAAPTDNLVREATETEHFTFEGWTVEAGTKVTGEIVIKPVYTREDHEFVETDESVGATCDKAGGIVWACECGATVTRGGKPATGHKWETTVIEPTYDAIGWNIKVCSECGKEEKTEIPMLTYKNLVVTVVENGAPVANKTVGLYKDGTWIANQVTNANGQVVFLSIEMGKYVLNVDNVGKDVTVNADTTFTFNLSEGQTDSGSDDNGSTSDCSCSCHRPGFWGMLFRFFHNIIKFFTGEIRCCADPDPKY